MQPCFDPKGTPENEIRPFNAYSPPEGGYCEAFEAQGRPRPFWKPFMDGIDAMGLAEFQKRILEAQAVLKKHGATHNLFDDPAEFDRPWELDLIPCLMPMAEWRLLESGLIQRAKLLDFLFRDIYGNQDFLKNRMLPPEFVMANPGFIPDCTGVETPSGRGLIFFAVDMVKTGLGQWRVVGDRIQLPSGPGFVLENRVIMSQVLSRIFHQNRVLRLAPFFINFQEMLRGAAFYNRDEPETVLLSPGPSCETYFEQAFLSRYLGYPMVESGDLTVRDNRVYVKTLNGLDPVDILFRWINDADIDPLALRSTTSIGVSGLIQAMRKKQISVVNPVGAGVLESAVFSTVLPGLSQKILKEELLLTGLPALWCGNPGDLEAFLEEPDRYILRCGPGPGVDTARLNEQERDLLFEAVKYAPHTYTAQEKTAISTIPSLEGSCLISKSVMYRFFIAASEDGFKVMGGGLARVSDDPDSLMASGGNDSSSKDIWVLSDGPVEQVSLLGRLDKAMDIRRSGDLPSRIADNLLWLGRYLERAENQVRLFRSLLKRLSGEVPFLEMPDLPTLLRMASDREMIAMERMESEGRLSLFEMQEEILDAVFDRNRPLSIASTLKAVQGMATRVRDRLSQDSWRVITRLDETLLKPGSAQWVQISATYDQIGDILVILSAFSGLSMENMTRGLGWRFMDMGRRIARLEDSIAMIRSAAIGTIEDVQTMLDVLLEVADSAMTYRYRYRTYLQFAPAMDLLISDEVNPRSLAFQLAALTDHVGYLPRNGERKYNSPEERILLQMLTGVRLADLASLSKPDNTGYRKGLDELLTGIENGVKEFSHHMIQHYLSRIPTTQHFTSLKMDHHA